MEAPHLSPRGRGAGLWRAPLPPANGSVVRTERRHHANEPIRAVRRACGGSAVRRPAGSHRRSGQRAPCRFGRRDERRRAGGRHSGHGDMAKAWGGTEQASIFNYGDKVPAHVAAFVNSLQLRSFDFEAIDAEGFLTRWPAHVTSTTVPAALALAEWKAMSGKDFLLAMLLGDDMACRLTEATRFDPLGCFDGNGTANCLGATAIASKALGLGAEQTLAAFGIALNMAGRAHAEHAGLLDLQAGERPVRLPRHLRRRNGPQRLQGPRRPDHGSQVLHGHVRQERRRVRVA